MPRPALRRGGYVMCWSCIILLNIADVDGMSYMHSIPIGRFHRIRTTWWIHTSDADFQIDSIQCSIQLTFYSKTYIRST
ncbi:uncharacterized protein F4812DRAFT_429786 [Daldinia caldariorum]|uniref:uncharacterized protein n=1 Tax=Daldinia caldariorum TaxID=326644 RepID=UPI002008A607|nr:uncharacterized protein F4812DRAFT_429786 [Daldinia caldariorum]KAI1467490.1 hypothetical protein F4812DRAFT_429786 [Daldinia caldariorum]